MHRSLLLNASYEPLAIIRDRDAVELYLEELADAVEYSGEVFRSPSITVQVPSVLALRQYVVMPARHRSIMLTPRNVCARDQHKCGYCQRHLNPGEGTIDHVQPRSRGGKNTWENVTAACRKCNGAKGDRTLEELGWKLERVPFRPVGVDAHLLKIQPQESWMPYLQVAS